MKALHFFKHGDTSELVYDDIETPKPQAGQVQVRVKAAALNHLDLWVLSGWPGLRLEMPHVGGADIAGTISALGEGVTNLKVGEEVVVNPGYVLSEDEYTKRGEECLSPQYKIIGEGCRGGFAEFAIVPAKNILKKPANIKFEEACSSLLVGLTSWRMLKSRAKLEKNESVLVVGAGGGVNSIAIQLAKAFGARVIALTSSEEKIAKAKKLGADEVINYRKVPDWSREVRRLTDNRGVDVVVDNVGAHTFAQSLNAVSRGGRIVSVGNTSGPNVSFDNRLLFSKQVSLLGSTMGTYKDFDEMTQFIWKHNIQAPIDRTLHLEEGKKAYEALERGEQFGKIVLIP